MTVRCKTLGKGQPLKLLIHLDTRADTRVEMPFLVVQLAGLKRRVPGPPSICPLPQVTVAAWCFPVAEAAEAEYYRLDSMAVGPFLAWLIQDSLCPGSGC